MATLASHQPADLAPTHWTEGNPSDDELAHIPGEAGWPIIGNTFRMLADPHGMAKSMVEKYGRVYKNKAFGGWNIALIGADANELVLFDRDKLFSSEQGWGPILDKLFPRGLMLMDFDHHRADRRALSIAFKPGPMRHYSGALNRGIAKRVTEWGANGSRGGMRFYPAIKELTLDLAADSFIGIPWGAEADRINRAFIDMVQASVAPVRRPLPFTQMKKGVDGRAFLVDYFTKETHRRRAEGGGQDMFSQFATAEYEDGSLMPVDEVVDHMNFLMMAAHDTITSSATSLLWLLAKHPEWQDKLRAEVESVTGGVDADGRVRDLAYEDLGKLELTEMAFKEALRFIPPVPSMPRRALRDFEYGGYRIPAGTPVGINIHWTHHSEDYWDEPEKFDPMRFTPEKVKARHKYAWVPFGGGAHMCLGLHFAYMQVKILMAQLLPRYRVELVGGDPEWQAWPIPKPKDGLKIALRAL
ncbi:cytochrome P450 [Erythrobacter sp. SN021]|uniref:cytochrome P450 n=1 Tax=Erythrobacter sp. SN021 TaxID=2912574 RepID=UPI000C68C6F8|nr:cytochrome P450 [Erythrobacter sp. SN021]MBL45460.1 cytochrome P450 [Sphingomonadaceae bacterium]MCF8883469.1 cytochrome P450 [Erythrobacter sp. SN021]